VGCNGVAGGFGGAGFSREKNAGQKKGQAQQPD